MRTRIVEFDHDGALISTDPTSVDLAAVHRSICDDSRWAAERSAHSHTRAIEHRALVVGTSGDVGEQLGFGRMVTDPAGLGRLADVHVVAAARGLWSVLVRTIVEHPEVVGIRRRMLPTADAHGRYERYGYRVVDEPSRIMHRTVPGVA